MLSRHCGGQKVARRRIMLACVLLGLVLVSIAVAVQFMPSGYRQLDCINSDENMRRSEKLLQLWTTLAKTRNFVWWADYGMLLGAVRNGHLLPWDKDMDGGFWQHDHWKLLQLQPMLEELGLALHGVTICYKEDLKRMDIDSELVVARLELFAYTVTDEGIVIRSDLKEAAQDHTIKGWLWWKAITWTMTSTLISAAELTPLSMVNLSHVSVAAVAGGGAAAVSTTTASDDAAATDPMLAWKISIPAPRNPALYLERLYGSTWKREVKWKLTCYM